MEYLPIVLFGTSAMGQKRVWGSFKTLEFYGAISNRDNGLVVHNGLRNGGMEILRPYKSGTPIKNLS